MLLFALIACSCAVLVSSFALSAVDVLYILAARSLCDTILSTVALLFLNWRDRRTGRRNEQPGELTRILASADPTINRFKAGARDGEGVGEGEGEGEGEATGPPAVLFMCSDVSLFARGTCYYAFLLGWYLSLNYLPVGVAIAVVHASPAITVPLCGVTLGETIPRVFWIIFVLMFSGVLLIARPWATWDSNGSAGYVALGVGFALSAVFAMAVFTVLTRRGARRQHVFHVQQSSGVTGILLVPLCFLVLDFCAGEDAGGTFAKSSLALADIPMLALIGTLSFAMMCCFKLAHDVAPNAATVSLVQMIEVPMGIAAQFFVFGEPVTPTDVAGVALILFGSALYGVVV